MKTIFCLTSISAWLKDLQRNVEHFLINYPNLNMISKEEADEIERMVVYELRSLMEDRWIMAPMPTFIIDYANKTVIFNPEIKDTVKL